MNECISTLRKFLLDSATDAILINSSDEFLSEYNILPRNSRSKVTGFSGSMGDCIVTQNNVYQIADGRYHQQADNEVDSDVVTVIKMQQGSSPINEIVSVLEKNSSLAVVANKVSADFCEKLQKRCDEKNIKIKYLSSDPLEDLSQNSYTNVELIRVSDEIASLSPKEKFEYFSSKLSEKQVLLVTVPTDFAYLTNLRNYDFPYSSAPRAKAVVTKTGVILFTNSKIPYDFEGLSVEPLDKFKNVLSKFIGKEILTDKSTISQVDFMQIHPSNKILPTDIFDIKSEKFDSEIESLKLAFSRTDRVLKRMDDLINSSAKLSEYDLFCAINQFFKEEGALTQSFKPIIASGENSSIIHYTVASSEKVIEDGDLVMIDCGGFFEGGLATDITRTFVKGTPTEEQKRIYTKVFKGAVAALAHKFDEAATWQQVDLFVRNELADEEKNGYLYSHSTGHGIGISVHEFPPRCSFQEEYAKPFKKNYVFSIEPGLYKKNVGGVRLENAVYAKSVSPKLEIEVLSHYPFEEKLINREMLTEKELKFLEDWQNYGKKNNIGI